MSVALDPQRLIPAWQSLQTLVPLTHIDHEFEYEQMTELLNCLLDMVRDDANHPLYSMIAVVGDLIETYELHQEPLDCLSKVAR